MVASQTLLPFLPPFPALSSHVLLAGLQVPLILSVSVPRARATALPRHVACCPRLGSGMLSSLCPQGITNERKRKLEQQLQSIMLLSRQFEHVQNFITWALCSKTSVPFLFSKELVRGAPPPPSPVGSARENRLSPTPAVPGARCWGSPAASRRPSWEVLQFRLRSRVQALAGHQDLPRTLVWVQAASRREGGVEDVSVLASEDGEAQEKERHF